MKPLPVVGKDVCAFPVSTVPKTLAGPIKRSITIAGHQTSISLEPIFWTALERAAAVRQLPLSALVARIDAVRVEAREPVNLASALRCWLFEDRLDAPGCE